jgi:hypothetical protein
MCQRLEIHYHSNVLVDIQDSLHLKHTLSQFTIPDTHILTSFDITNMYPSIPRIPAIAALRCLLERDHTLKQHTSMSIDDIITLQEAVLRPAHFQWLGVYYAQTDGCAMGDSTSSPVSNAYMTEFEKDILTSYHLIHDPHHIPPAPPPVSVILFWFRQADNTMMAIHRDHVATFHAFLNSVHENIKWTFESEVDGRINMLDLTTLRQSDGSLEFDVF